MTSQIYLDGRHYDRLYPAKQDEAAWSFWVEAARRGGGAALELACGTGRLAIALAQTGCQVTGLDLARPMLDEARRKAAAAGVEVEWTQADMTDFYLDRRHGLIALVGNALCHLLDLTAFERCMSSVRSHLAVGGRFIISVFVPDCRLLLRDPDRRYPFGRYEDPDGHGTVVVTERSTYEPNTQIKRVRTFHQFPGAGEEVVSTLDLRMYYPQELDALLRYNGLAIEAKYGDETGKPFGPESSRQVIVCRLA